MMMMMIYLPVVKLCDLLIGLHKISIKSKKVSAAVILPKLGENRVLQHLISNNYNYTQSSTWDLVGHFSTRETTIYIILIYG